MKTAGELKQIFASCPISKINAHVHTHLCDGRPEMTVKNIGEEAERAGIALVVLTPHVHKRVSDDSETLYSDTDPAILTALREEITAYQTSGGATRFLLSAEADILSEAGDLSLVPSPEIERALDLITPTLNYHPLLPLKAVHLTYGKDRDTMHESGEYARMARAAGGVEKVLESLYAAQANAIKRAPYPALLGHFFAAHSFATRYNWFGAEPKHLPLMLDGARRVADALQKADAMADITGIIPHGRTPEQMRAADGFLYQFQQNFLVLCRARGVYCLPGSDAHALAGIRESLCYEKIFGTDL